MSNPQFSTSAPTTPSEDAAWSDLFRAPYGVYALLLTLAVFLYASNTLLMTTIMPTALKNIGGVELMSWATSFFLVASVLSASSASLISARLGLKTGLLLALTLFTLGTLTCAAAPSMSVMLFGRCLQGAGGGLLNAFSYAIVSRLFPQMLWTRMFATLSGCWGFAALLGPLVGGVFADLGMWRGAFISIALLAGLLAIGVFVSFPAPSRDEDNAGFYPFGRLSLVALGVGAISVGGLTDQIAVALGLILAGIVAFAGMITLDLRASKQLFPKGAFRLNGGVGLALWIVLFVSIAIAPPDIYSPLFLQTLHGLSATVAGYVAATQAFGWTFTALFVASLPLKYAPRLIVGAPLMMGVGLIGVSAMMAPGPIWMLLLMVYLVGAGIGGCWTFLSMAAMRAAEPGDEERVGSSIASLQLIGLALGASLSGVVANLAGLRFGVTEATVTSASQWLPAVFCLSGLLAAGFGLRLYLQEKRSPQKLFASARES